MKHGGGILLGTIVAGEAKRKCKQVQASEILGYHTCFGTMLWLRASKCKQVKHGGTLFGTMLRLRATKCKHGGTFVWYNCCRWPTAYPELCQQNALTFAPQKRYRSTPCKAYHRSKNLLQYATYRGTQSGLSPSLCSRRHPSWLTPIRLSKGVSRRTLGILLEATESI